MHIAKNVRFFILLAILLLSLYFLITPFIFKPSGVIVITASKEAKCSQIKEGDVITQFGSVFTKNVVDFKIAVSAVKIGDHIRMIVNNGPGWCTGIKDGDVGVDVADIPSSQLKFGIDIQGGTAVTYKPTSEMNLKEIARTIEKRIEVFGLPETRVVVFGNNIKIISLTTEKLNIITATGEFEAKIKQEINIENKSGIIKIGLNTHPVKVTDTMLTVNESSYAVNQIFVLDGIGFNIINITNNSFAIEASIFTNEDILKVLNEFSYARYNPDFRRNEFNIPLEISKEAINRFKNIVRGLGTSFAAGQTMLNGQLVYYLDGKEISTLSIPFEMTTQEITNLAVLGFGNTLAEATTQKLRVQAALNSNKLPDLELVVIEYYEPSLRLLTMIMFLIGALIVLVLISGATHLRYRKIKLAGYMLLLISSEVFCIVGVAAITQKYYSPGWILDFSSMLGVLTFLFVSSVQKLLLTEKRLKNNELSLQFKHKKIVSLTNFLSILFLIIPFLLLFTGWKGYGLSVFVGMVISLLITSTLYQNILKV